MWLCSIIKPCWVMSKEVLSMPNYGHHKTCNCSAKLKPTITRGWKASGSAEAGIGWQQRILIPWKPTHQLQVGLHEAWGPEHAGKHLSFWHQLKWASSQSISINRIGPFRTMQSLRALVSKQSVCCCWQDQTSLTNKFLDTKWHCVYIYPHIWPQPQCPYNTNS